MERIIDDTTILGKRTRMKEKGMRRQRMRTKIREMRRMRDAE